MKKNLILLMALISVLIISIISAGITGYVINLKQGDNVSFQDVNISNIKIDKNSASFMFGNDLVQLNPGDVKEMDGIQIELREVKSSLLSRMFNTQNAELIITPLDSISISRDSELNMGPRWCLDNDIVRFSCFLILLIPENIYISLMLSQYSAHIHQ